MVTLSSDEGLCALEFSGPRRQTRLDRRLARWFPPHEIADRTSPTIADKRLYLRDRKNIYCLDIAGK